MRDGFILHIDYLNREEFSAEEIGLLTLAMCDYYASKAEPKFKDRAMRTEWKRIKQRMDLDEDAYQEKCRTNKENGSKGGRPRKEEKTERFSEETEKTERFSEKPKKPDIDIELESDIDIDSNSTHTTVFIPPTEEEVEEYVRARKYKHVNAKEFIAHYSSKGWKVGSQPMTSWKASADGWEIRKGREAKARSGTTRQKNKFNAFEQRDYDYAALEQQLLAKGGSG